MTLLLDISRLVENLHLATPTGIDRVEMAYAQHLLARAATDDVRFVVTWPNFSGVLPAHEIKPIIDESVERWSRGAVGRSDQSLASLRVALLEPIDRERDRPLQIGSPDDRRALADWQRMMALWLRSAARRINAASIAELRSNGGCYIHASQFRLNRPERFAWLDDASLCSIFLLHDLIPIAHPEYCRPGEAVRHRARIDTASRHATRIVTISEATRHSLLA